MSDTVALALIATIPSIISGVAAVIAAINARQAHVTADSTHNKLVEVGSTVNGRMDQLIEETERRATVETLLHRRSEPPSPPAAPYPELPESHRG